MKQSGMSLVAAILVLVTIAPAGLAQERKGLTRNIVVTFKPPNAAQQKNIARQLELTEKQKPQLKSVSEKWKRQTTSLKKSYDAAYQEVVRLMNSESPNKKRVNNSLKSFNATHQRVLEAEVDYWMDLKTILTPAQNLKLWKIFEKNRIR